MTNRAPQSEGRLLPDGIDAAALLERRRTANEGKLLDCDGCRKQYRVTWSSVYGIILGYTQDGRPRIQDVWGCPSCRVDTSRGGAPAYPEDMGKHVFKRANPLSQKDYLEIRPLTDKERLYLLAIDSGVVVVPRREG